MNFSQWAALAHGGSRATGFAPESTFVEGNEFGVTCHPGRCEDWEPSYTEISASINVTAFPNSMTLSALISHVRLPPRLEICRAFRTVFPSLFAQ